VVRNLSDSVDNKSLKVFIITKIILIKQKYFDLINKNINKSQLN
jgi:hypothetical protein